MPETTAPPADAPVIDADAPATPPAAIDPEEHARTKAALKAANKEAEAHRLKLAAYEKAETEKAEQEMTASQRADARATKAEQEAADARAELNTERLRNSFFAESQKAQYGADGKGKIADWEAAFILIKADPANKDLEPSGVADALKAASKKYPLLVGAPTIGAPPATPPESETNITTAEKQRQREEHERRVRQNKP